MNILTSIRFWWLSRPIRKQNSNLKKIKGHIKAIQAHLVKIIAINSNSPKLVLLEEALFRHLKFAILLETQARESIQLAESYRAAALNMAQQPKTYEEALEQFEKDTQRQLVELSEFIEEPREPSPENPVP